MPSYSSQIPQQHAKLRCVKNVEWQGQSVFDAVTSQRLSRKWLLILEGPQQNSCPIIMSLEEVSFSFAWLKVDMIQLANTPVKAKSCVNVMKGCIQNCCWMWLVKILWPDKTTLRRDMISSKFWKLGSFDFIIMCIALMPENRGTFVSQRVICWFGGLVISRLSMRCDM